MAKTSDAVVASFNKSAATGYAIDVEKLAANADFRAALKAFFDDIYEPADGGGT